MARLTEAQRAELLANLQRELSEKRITTADVNKTQLAALVAVFDAGLETAEAAILADVAAGPRAWLMANQTTARRLLEYVARWRREVL